MNTKRSTPIHNRIKIAKVTDKKITLKAARVK